MENKKDCPCLSKDFSNQEDEFAVFDEDTGLLIVCENGQVKKIQCEGKE